MASERQEIRSYKCVSLSKFLHDVADEINLKPSGNQGPILLWRGQEDAGWALHPRLKTAWKGSPNGLEAAEKKMFQEFRQAAPYLLPSVPTNDWERLSMAQHYGMKTRLLDW